ncbi:MAG: GtrA family protein [Candidatus Izemoplasmatales bacterium]
MKNKENLTHIIKFTLFSISAGLIQIISFTLINEIFNVPYWPAYLIALILSVLWNFTLNRKFTFKSAANIPKAMFKVMCYYLVFTPLSTWWGNELELIGWNEYIILGGTMLINFVTEFIFTKFYVYKNNINTAIQPIIINKDIVD